MTNRLYRLARSRAVPKGRPGAKRSGHARPWEWRKDARPSASEQLLLPCGVRQLERQKTGQRLRYLQSAGCHMDIPCSKRLGVISGELLESSAKLLDVSSLNADHRAAASLVYMWAVCEARETKT